MKKKLKMKQTKVAIQGAYGSFHELAAKKHFDSTVDCVECVTFKNVFDSVINNETDFGITAIENTVAGTILPNYAMLRDSGVQIIGEVYLHIQQNLITLKGQSIENIKEVHSHPMAILQCQTFFGQYPHILLVQADDTAAVARRISEQQLKHIGAIAGTHVAGMYNLQLLAQAIETHKKNFTRFLVIKKSDGSILNNPKGEVDKATICFNVVHENGSLAKVLTKLAQHNINLTKIQSMPIIGKEWQYYIHVDMEFDSYDNYQNALSDIKPSLSEIKIMGEYKRGIKEGVPVY
jgi:prephenate dehydratase